MFQFIARIIGVLFIIFPVYLSTEIGEIYLNEGLGLPFNNAAFRVLSGIENDIPSLENTAVEDNNQPIYGIIDIKSFVFMVTLLIGFILVSYDLRQIQFIIRESIFRSPAKMNAQMVILANKLKNMSDQYYTSGASGIDSAIRTSEMPRVWPVLIENIQLKIPFDDIVEIMGNEAGIVRKQYDLHLKAVSTLANILPSLGIIGTVLGLIKLLFNLTEPTLIGPSMALALLTTLYGLFISVLIIKPIGVRLENVKNLQMDAFQVAAFWVGLLSTGKPSFYVEQKFIDKF
ncbi:chemotaxis protein MotA [Spirochaetota bacterium]|nr:chemotaxis protein MotA [Spirochaetota bacterium]